MSTAVAKNYREQLAEEAAELAKRVQAPGGDLVRVTQDKKFVLPDGTKSDGPMTVVILDFIAGNFFYDRPFKADEIVPPACFAQGLEPNKLVPDASSPVKQAEDCQACPNNAFGSKGAGKACNNARVLAVIPEGAGADAKPMLLKVSATGIKAFDAYVKMVKAQFDTLPIGVVTDVYFDPSVTYASLRFGNTKPNDKLEEHFALKAAARERLLTPLDVTQYVPPKGKKSAAKAK